MLAQQTCAISRTGDWKFHKAKDKLHRPFRPLLSLPAIMSDEPLEDVYGDFGMTAEFEPAAQDPSLWGQAAPAAAAGIASLDDTQFDAEQGPPLVKVDEEYMADATLYADLYDEEGGPRETLLKTQVAELQDRVRQQEGELLQLRKQVEELQQQNEELEQQRSTLATNISSLYKTAKLELQRKDAEIKELRERVATPPGRAAASRRGPADPTRPAGQRHPQAQHTTRAVQQDGQQQPREQQQQQQQQQRESGEEQRAQDPVREQDGAPKRTAGGNSTLEGTRSRGSVGQEPGQRDSHQPLGGSNGGQGREAERQPTYGGATRQGRGRGGSSERERGRSQGRQREARDGGGSRQQSERSRGAEHGRCSERDRSDRPKSRDEDVGGGREALRGGRDQERRRGGGRDKDDKEGGDKGSSYHDPYMGSREREGRSGSSRDRTGSKDC